MQVDLFNSTVLPGNDFNLYHFDFKFISEKVLVDVFLLIFNFLKPVLSLIAKFIYEILFILFRCLFILNILICGSNEKIFLNLFNLFAKFKNSPLCAPISKIILTSNLFKK